MKKIQIFALSAVCIFGAMATACEGGANTPSVTLKSDADTLSYAYGVQLASGLNQYLNQLGVVQDTAMFKTSYQQRIAAETDTAKKAVLEKELPAKLDSLNKANAKNLAQFIKGLNESFNSTNKTQDAYLNGLQVGSQLKQVSDDFQSQAFPDGDKQVNKAAVLTGLLNSLKHEKLAIENSKDLMEAKMKEAQSKEQAKMMAEQAKQEEEAKKEHAAQIEAGKKFMEENKTKNGVVTLPSGLQYKIVKKGTGAIPTINDQVEVFYKGSLPDGTVFETNVGKESVKFGVGQVIKGWTEALQLMPVGSKWILYIPYDLAYGSQNAGPIPAFSNLIFEIELVSIQK